MSCATSIALRVLKFAALGAISTVAIAWASAMYWDPVLVAGGASEVIARPDGVITEPQYIVLERSANAGLVCWSVVYRSTHSNPPHGESTLRENIDRWAGPFVLPRLPEEGGWLDYPFIRPLEVVFVVGAGWPRSAMMYASEESTPPRTPAAWTTTGGYEVRALRHARTGYPAVLPLRPVWDGLALDTAFWAAVWWGTVMVPRLARQHWRKSRGRCASCGYDRRGLAPGARCPECGCGAPRTPAVPALGASA